ncbi:MAG: M14 family metallopeptidase [Lachnospiraceae bacterium]|nr:M14 family metallopeptidase [Lachnospiraceae bacterium]
MWEICGHTLSRGEKKQAILDTGIEGYRLPATMICGKEEGKTVVVTACIHGDEYPGTAAVIRLARKLEAQEVKGNLLFIHCVNMGGFWGRSRVLPEDGFNLNSDYPGKAEGTPGERLAFWFIQKIFPGADFILDLHSGSPMEPLTPCLFFPKAEKVRQTSLTAAMALDVPYLIESSSSKGEYGYAANYFDVPGLLLERGHSGLCPEEWIEAYRRDICRLLEHLEMYAGEKTCEKPEETETDEKTGKNLKNETTCEKKIITKAVYLEAEEQGLWYPAVFEGCRVQKGQLLGHIEDFFGNVQKEYRAEMDGIVFYYTGSLAVKKGSSLAAYGA